MKDKIVIIGGGGHAKVLISIIKKINAYEIIGYCDIKNNGNILGIKYIGNDNGLEKIISKYPKCSAIIGIGKTNTKNDIRKNVFDNLTKLGFNIQTIISPDSLVNEETKIDKGTVVFDSVTINSGTIIGYNCIINTGAVIEHDCIIGNNVFIGPNATINGKVTIESNSFIGSNSTIIQNVSICSNSLVGAGSVVINSIYKPGVYVGNPVRKIK